MIKVLQNKHQTLILYHLHQGKLLSQSFFYLLWKLFEMIPGTVVHREVDSGAVKLQVSLKDNHSLSWRMYPSVVYTS